MPADLFISYCWGGENAPNQQRVKHLKSTLESSYNFKIWMDISEMSVGHQFLEKIESGIRQAKVVLIVLTEEYLDSRNCKKEIALADGLGKEGSQISHRTFAPNL